MAEEIKTSKPNVGIRGNPQSTQIYQKGEKLEGPQGSPNFGATFNALALSPTNLGIIGSTLLTTASTALAQRYGQSLGKNPQGNLLPPITNFDKNVAESYKVQAQVTLGNQAQQMMYQAEEEMAKHPKLTPGLISSYKKNMVAGLKETIDLAPDSIKPQLENHLVHQLQTNVHQYNNRLLSQQKSDAESAAAVWRVHQNDSVTNQVKDAKTKEDFKAAEESYNSLISNIKGSSLSASQKDTAITAAKLNYESAKSVQKLMEARANGEESKYLASIADKKIEGLSWSESENVRNNTVKYLNEVEVAAQRDQALIMSDAQLKMRTPGAFTEANLAQLRDELTPINFNKVAFEYAKAQSKNNSQAQALQEIIANPGDATAYVGKKSTVINGAFDLLTAQKKQFAANKGYTISDDEAQFQAASQMNTIVPKYIDRLNREMANGNPQQVVAALDAEARLHELDGNKTIGMDEKAIMAAEIFKVNLASQTVDPDTALTNARQAVYNKDKETIIANKAAINGYISQHAGNPQARLSTAINLSGISNSKNIDNKAAFQADVYSRFRAYMNLSNGDIELSKKRLQADVAKIWGETKVNGKSEITRLGVEQALSVPQDAAPFIQEDVITQLGPQLKDLKDLYDKGGSPHYWKIKEGRVNFSDYSEAQLALHKDGLKDPKYSIHKQLIKKFESGAPIEIEQVSRNGTQTWHVEVSSSAYAQRSPTTGQVSGFNIWVRHPETGEMGALTGFYGATHVIPSYTPNRDWIEHSYTSNLANPGLSQREYIEARLHPKPIKSAKSVYDLSVQVNKELNQ